MGASLRTCGRICGSEEAAVAAKEVALSAQPTRKGAGWSGRVAATPVEDEGFICSGGPAPICPTGPKRAQSDWDKRVAATPIDDEGFICSGGPAPICPTGNEMPDGALICPWQSTGAITMETLQGSWRGSSGSSISVLGTAICINGLPLQGHSIELDDNGIVVSIGRLWQLDKWAEDWSGPKLDGSIEFRASSTREGMESARSEVWTRADESAVGSDEWKADMKARGYGGSSADPLGRGIDGCMPGTMGIEVGEGYAKSRDKRDVELLKALISQWREPLTDKVHSCDVLPDFVNRSQTGIGVELLHYVASRMADLGFLKRVGKEGHDIPVVVREPIGSSFREEALRIWTARVAVEDGFPPVRVDVKKEFFTSLGNGHFFQSLNLFATECKGINQDRVYRVGKDVALREAIRDGVPSVVMKSETPRPVRAKIAELLNSKREFSWTLGEDGQVDLATTEDSSHCSQFDG